MAAAGFPQSAVLSFALSIAYGQIGIEGFVKSRWRNVAYATRYGKGCTLFDALCLDLRGISDYMEGIAYCVQQEAKASKKR